MHRFNKSKRGFTLIEVILVIGMIVILVSVLYIAVSDIIQRANSASNSAEASRTALTNARNVSEAQLGGYHF